MSVTSARKEPLFGVGKHDHHQHVEGVLLSRKQSHAAHLAKSLSLSTPRSLYLSDRVAQDARLTAKCELAHQVDETEVGQET
eukprot:2824205-Pyramimonas_sp.AAC.1